MDEQISIVMNKKHHVKILPQYFRAVLDGIKNAEVRYNDRGYEEGDCLELQEWTGTSYTGFCILRKIKAVYELNTIGLDNYVLLCLE